MIKIENTETYGWDAAIRGMRNPLNSWDKIDSQWDGLGDADGFEVGPNDLSLMQKLVNAGSDHSKFMRMLTVYMDITAPLYWWKEYDTYKVGTVANSCSTMHKIHDREFEDDDFSHEHLFGGGVGLEPGSYFEFDDELFTAGGVLNVIIDALNHYRKKYLETKDKTYWWQMIQLLPSSYNQRRTVELNYAVLRNMYHARKNHKLDEWRDFCDYIVNNLPYAEELICS